MPYHRPMDDGRVRDDAELVRAARDGDRDAFAAIYDRYAGRLHDFLCSVLRDRDGAADILHDTFIVAGARLHQLRDPAKLRPWLYAIARHLALRDVERRARQEPLGEAEVSDPGRDAADVAGAGELAELVAAAAEGLNARDRVVLDLHLRQGLEGQELGEALGVSAGHAYVVLSRLRDQVERSLGALLVARQGRRDCEDLAAVLAGWDGRFTTVWRKRVARHVDGCSTCSDLRRRVASPTALLSAAPAMALPAGLRQRVLDDVQLVSHAGRPWPASRHGFPPPTPGLGRRRAGVGAVAAAVVLVLLAGAALLERQRDVAVDHLATAAATTTAPAGSTRGPGTTGTTAGATVTTTAVPAPPTSGPMTTGTPRTVVADPTPPTTATTVTRAIPPTTGSTEVTRTTATTTPEVTSPPDRSGPTIHGVRVDPGVVAAASRCTLGDPATARVTASTSDPSGISGVTLEWGGPQPGTAAMTVQRDGTWAATVGPFSFPARAPVEIPLTVRAVDRAANTSTATAELVARCG